MTIVSVLLIHFYHSIFVHVADFKSSSMLSLADWLSFIALFPVWHRMPFKKIIITSSMRLRSFPLFFPLRGWFYMVNGSMKQHKKVRYLYLNGMKWRTIMDNKSNYREFKSLLLRQKKHPSNWMGVFISQEKKGLYN